MIMIMIIQVIINLALRALGYCFGTGSEEFEWDRLTMDTDGLMNG